MASDRDEGDLQERPRTTLRAVGSRMVRAQQPEPSTPPGSGVMVIGSHPACDLVLPGLRPQHAVLGRDVWGRSVLKALAGGCLVDGSPVISQVVDAHSEIEVGGHRIVLALSPRLA